MGVHGRVCAGVLLFAVLCGVVGCTSPSPYLLPESDAESQAPGEAFNEMMFRKPMPDHRDDRAYEFYYKHCALSGEDDYFSPTAYDCTTP